MRHKVQLLLLLLCSVMASCDESPDWQTNRPLMVVEGWIENGEFPVVMLSQTIPVTDERQDMDSLANYIIKWGVVRISDGEKEVVLTGKYDKGYFPPYIYTTSDLRGEAGKTYTLRADYKDFHVTASTTIPKPVEKMDVSWTPSPKDEALCQLFVDFESNGESDEFYKVFVRSGRQSKQYLSAYMGLADCSHTAAGHIRIPAYRAKSMQNDEYTPYFLRGEEVSVKLARISKESFTFWNEYEQILSLSGNLFFPMTDNFHSNIKGGTGYWAGYGKQEISLKIL